MGPTDSAQTLLNLIPMFTSRDWGSPEKNSRAVELARSIREAVHLRDDAKVAKLVQEVQFFMAPTFVFFKRLERLAGQEYKWRTTQDDTTWSGMMDRTRTIVERNDKVEVVEIAPRIIAFLRKRNGHVLAQNIQEALDMCRRSK